MSSFSNTRGAAESAWGYPNKEAETKHANYVKDKQKGLSSIRAGPGAPNLTWSPSSTSALHPKTSADLILATSHLSLEVDPRKTGYAELRIPDGFPISVLKSDRFAALNYLSRKNGVRLHYFGKAKNEKGYPYIEVTSEDSAAVEVATAELEAVFGEPDKLLVEISLIRQVRSPLYMRLVHSNLIG